MSFEDLLDNILDDIVKTDGEKERTEDITQYVAFVLDKSGSMGMRKDDAIRDFNEQIDSLREESGSDINTLVTVTQFNDEVKTGNVVSLDEIQKLNDGTYRPDGYTALYDAIGETALRLMKQYREDNSDAAVLMVIITDGMENASEKYDAEKIKSIIKDLEGTGRWTFSYMGIGSQDEMFRSAASQMGFAMGNIAVAANTAKGSSANISGTQMLYQARRVGETQTSCFYSQTDDSADEDKDKWNSENT